MSLHSNARALERGKIKPKTGEIVINMRASAYEKSYFLKK
jgi:hypothetical protein